VPTYYADSSVLLKRHIHETGSVWVQELTDPVTGNSILTARVSMVEVFSALNRRVPEGNLAPADYTIVANDFVAVCATEYQLIELLPQIADRARRVLETYPLRAYDAIQLASALVANDTLQAQGLNPLTFLGADHRLLDAALAEGLTTVDPNTHP
jgi:uncharacterized protein